MPHQAQRISYYGRLHHLTMPIQQSGNIKQPRIKVSGISSLLHQSKDDAIISSIDNNERSSPLWQQYFSMMRPITIIQAVGAFLVGTLVILLSHQQQTTSILMNQSSTVLFQKIIMASISIYTSYGAGMAMNDCADAVVDSQHTTKQSRSIASEAVSIRNGWIFCIALSMVSLAFASLANPAISNGSFGFVQWTAVNLLLMAGYALGMQKLFLVKNILCGFFAISPLVGASTLFGSNMMNSLSLGGSGESDITMKLYQLAAIGFPLQVSREILKDIEDVEVDRGEKQTLPLVVGKVTSKRIAYGLVGIVNGAMIFSPYYWNIFASMPPVYAISVAIGTPMCVAASRMPLVKGQQLLKKSIYVLLSGMISGLLVQSFVRA